jgi:hypothetical protein
VATKTWTGGGTTANPLSGAWSKSADWSPAGVPQAGDDVIVDGSGSYKVTLGGNTAALDSLLINNPGVTLAVGKFTLQVTGAGASALHLQSGKMTIAAGTIAASGMQIDSGSLSGNGTVAAPLTGAGTVKASGGSLDLTRTVAKGLLLRIDTTTPSDLKIDSTATAGAIPITSANQTLEIGSGGNLTIGAKESITNGSIRLDGGILRDNSGIVIGSGAALSGNGTVAGALSVSGSGTIGLDGGTLTDGSGIVFSQGGYLKGRGVVAAPLSGGSGNGFVLATNGTLELQSTANVHVLELGDNNSSSGEILKLDAASAAGGIDFNGSAQTLEIGAGASLTIGSNILSYSGGTYVSGLVSGTIQVDGGTLTDSLGPAIDLGGGLLTGHGTVAAQLIANSNVQTGTVAASGGTLEVTGPIALSPGNALLALSIGGGASDRLLLDAASSATSLGFAGATGALELNTAASLSLANALAIGANTVQLDGTGSTLTDAGGVTLAGGEIIGLGDLAANTDLSGYGTVGIPLDSADTVTASGGTLEFTAAVDGTVGSTFHIGSTAGSVLKFDGAVGAGAVNPSVIFDGGDGGAGILDLTSTSLANFHGIVAGFSDGEGIKVANATSGTLDSTGTVLTVFNGSSALGTITFVASLGGDTVNVSGGVISISDLTATLTSTTATEGAPISVNVTDDGAPVTGSIYQWQVSHDSGATWANATGLGAASATYTPAEADEGGVLRALVTYAEVTGTESATSNLANAVLDAAPSLSVVQSGNAVEGQTLIATPTASSDEALAVSYQWQSSGDGGATWNPIAGATGATYVQCGRGPDPDRDADRVER